MTTRLPQTPADLSLRFGLGVNSVASDDQIDDRECLEGKNCVLLRSNSDFIARPPFDLVGTVPNGQEIRGLICLHNADVTASMLVQAGGSIYEWDGTSDSSAPFSLVGSCDATARLRGRVNSHQWPLAPSVVLITDLDLKQPVMAWNGTTLYEPIFHNNDSSQFGNFYARYCVVRNERAIFAGVRDNASLLEHVLVGSAQDDFETINVTQSSGLNPADPFFLVAPDLKDINGFVEAFGQLIISTERGAIWKLTGADATDFAFASLFPGSGAVGDESVAFVGNDVVYGRQGRLESLQATDTFGDVATDDLTKEITDLVEDAASWISVYNSRNQRIYFFADGGPKLWVFFKSVEGGSRWMLWETNHSLSFQPTCVMNCYDPVDGLEYVFMGDSSGNLYRMEGTYQNGGDGGTDPIVAERLSKLFVGGLDSSNFAFDGWVRAKSPASAEVEVSLEYVDERGFPPPDKRRFDVLDPFGDLCYFGGTEAGGDACYFGGTVAEGDAAYFSALGRGPFTRYKVGYAGSGHDFQIRTKVTGDAKTTIGEIGLRFRAAK